MTAARAPLERHYRADTFALVHQVKSIVNLTQWHGVGNHLVDIDFTFHVPVDNLGDIRSPPRTAKRRAAP